MSFGLKLQLEHYVDVGREIKRKCVYMQTQNIKMCIVIVIIYTKYVQAKNHTKTLSLKMTCYNNYVNFDY